MLNKKIFLKACLFAMIAGIVFFDAGFCQSEDSDEFNYSREGRRDPFVSLIDGAGGVRQTAPDKNQEMMEAVATVKVGGIIWDEEMPLAMINNEIRRIGDIVNKLEIKEITPDAVIFGYADLTYTFTIIEKKNF